MTEILSRPIVHPSAWRGSEIAGSLHWIERLVPDEVAELEAAARPLLERGVEVTSIAREDFALPRLAARIARWAHEINHGRGFVLVRGLPVERYDDRMVRTIYWGIGRHLGNPVSQNAYGELLADVFDEGVKMGQGVRGYRTNERHLFHTDRADIVGLLCLRKARLGGISKIVSSMTVFNEILAHHPEYLPFLFDGYLYMNVEEGGDSATWRVPIYSLTDGVLSCRSSRNTIETARRLGIAKYGPVETAALEHFDALAESEALRLDMDLVRGDMQFINNYTTLHARTSYQDGPNPAERRLMVRIWLAAHGTRRPRHPSFREYDGVAKKLDRARPAVQSPAG